MTPDIQELKDKALTAADLANYLNGIDPYTILALIESVKRQREALDEIAHGEIHTRDNGKTFRCQMSGRAMQAKARAALKETTDEAP